MLNVYRFSVLLPGPRDGSTISRFCAAFEIEFRRKSSRLCSSPAKYIWVVIMWKNPPYALKWTWGGRIQPPGTGYAPGLIVLSAFDIYFRSKSSRLGSSPTKYIWVVIMWKNPPYALKWTWGGRIHPPGTGYAPGLIVLNEYMPFSSVRVSPKPRKFGSFGAGFGSATWTYRPFALACQISTMAPLTGRHSSSVARPVT